MKHTIKVPVDASTLRWIRALAKSNSGAMFNRRCIRPATLLATAAAFMADYAGRDNGTWRSDVARPLLLASGFQTRLPFALEEKLRAWEKRRQRRNGSRTR